MIIVTLIICCLTLIAVGVGLFLNRKSNLNTLSTLSSLEETINKSVEDLKTEILGKIQDFKENTQTKFDTTKTEIQTTIKDNLRHVHEELITKARESDQSNYNTITSSKSAILESLEPKMSDLKKETTQYLEKLSTEIHNKIDSALQLQEQQQNNLINEVKAKFIKIIEEIKSPLTLD